MLLLNQPMSPVKSINCSICVSTYNRPDALWLCVESILKQSRLPNEIIIGDDGSGSETAEVIAAIKQKSTIPVSHVWQPDEGYRLAACRNKSFAAAKGEYILQIDGDVILHNDFVADHLSMARPGTFVSGSRVLLTPDYTQKVIAEKHFEKPSFFSKNMTKRYNAIHSNLLSAINYRIQRGKGQYKHVLGANMAFYKEDLVRINGYDENFGGWGKEDNNIAIRLCNVGVAIRFLKFGGIVYHLHHDGEKNNNVYENEILLQDAIRSNTTFVSNGLNSHI